MWKNSLISCFLFVAFKHIFFYSFQSTTSLLQPSPSSVWPSWSSGLCVWLDHVLGKAKEETTSSNLLACFLHLQVGSLSQQNAPFPAGFTFWDAFAFNAPLMLSHLRFYYKFASQIHILRFLRHLCVHLAGGDAPVCKTDDRERGHNLDPILLRLVLRLRLYWLCPPLSLRHCTPHPLHAPDAQESMGDVHGRRAGSSRVTTGQKHVVLLFWLKCFSRTRVCHQRIKVTRETIAGVCGSVIFQTADPDNYPREASDQNPLILSAAQLHHALILHHSFLPLTQPLFDSRSVYCTNRMF